MVNLKMQQYKSPRFPALETYCKIPEDHPKYLEPAYNCQPECQYCKLYEETRNWIEVCYHAQHQANSMPSSKGNSFS